MRFIGNLIWLLFGGVFIALEYVVFSFMLIITIIGIPFGFQTLKLAGLALWPFGKKIRYREQEPGCLSLFMSLLWLIFGGIWIFLTHMFFGILLGITIIGIPFAKQHFKLAGLALAPFGKEVLYK
jgi:uncharacterized membrane protein YccF (DUF307 family)